MATQKGRNWSSGDIVTAANLQSIERGVNEVTEEYTPTTWANGNTVTAVALNNIEQGIVNASGGSSDFSAATVTIAVNGDANTDIFGAFYTEDEYGAYTYANINSTVAEAEPLNIVLYKGYAFLVMNNAANITAVGTGDITINDNLYCDVTGDCTITISPK